MLTQQCPSRCGTTLVELAVAMTLAGVVLAAAFGSMLHQQRTTDRVAALALGQSQLAAASVLVPGEISALSATAGDLVAGQARDTAFQLRAPIAAAVACDTGVAGITISSDETDVLAPRGSAAQPHTGDSLWWYAERSGLWTGRRIISMASGIAFCGVESPSPDALRLALDGTDTIPAWAPIRVTRQLRYDFYRSSDGSWQLGVREWSDALQRFAPPQPLAGPFMTPHGGDLRTGFRYFDAAGAELAPNETGVQVPRVARIRVTVVAPARSAGGVDIRLADSADVAIARAP